MEWMTLLYKIFELCIIPLIGVVSGFLIQYIRTKTQQLNNTNKNEVQKKYLSMLSETVIDCVIATNQTYVDTLKAEGKFDAEAQAIAFEKTYQAVINILNDDAKAYLTNIYGDLTVYIKNMIEAEVKRNK